MYSRTVDEVTAAAAALRVAADRLARAVTATDDGSEVLEGTAAALTIADRLTSVAVRGVDRSLSRGLASAVEDLPTEAWLRLTAKQSGGDPSTLCQVTETLRSLPSTAARFHAGLLSWSQTRQICAAARTVHGEDRTHLDAVAAGAADAGSSEPDVVVWEAEQTIETLRGDLVEDRAERAVEREAVQVEGRLDGAGRLTAVLGAVALAELLDALDGIADDPSTEVSRGEQHAEALLRLARLATGGPTTTGQPCAAHPNLFDGAPDPDEGETADGEATSDEAVDGDAATGPGDGNGDGASGGDGGGGPVWPSTGATDPVTGAPLLDGHMVERALGPAPCTCGAPRRGRPRVHAVIDVHALCAEHDGPAGRLWTSTVGRPVTLTRTDASLLACLHGLIPVAFDGANPIAIGDAETPISVHLERAVRLRDGGCRFPSCTAAVRWCDAHHVTWREHGGATCLDNLVLVCRKHHRKLHRRGWTAHLDPTTGTLTLRRRGRTWVTHPWPDPTRPRLRPPAPRPRRGHRTRRPDRHTDPPPRARPTAGATLGIASTDEPWPF